MARGSKGNITKPDFLIQERSGARSAKIKSGKGVKTPGFRRPGTGKSAASEKLQSVSIKKVVDPQHGQTAATPGAGFRYYGRSEKVLSVDRKVVPRSVSPTKGSKVIRPSKTAVRVGVGGRTKIKNV